MKITEFYNLHKGETCYILGNGPSLNDIDLFSLQFPTFGTNRIYLAGYEPDYYACVNPLVLEQFGDEISKLSSTKFIVDTFEQYADIPINTRNYHPSFSSPEGAIWEGHTVTYVCLQLAYYMGFERVILLGLDHYYEQGDFGPNQRIRTNGDDPNHFHPDYFGDGVEWHTADLPRSEIAYSLAKRAYEKDGRKIINCSTSTKLDIFKIQSLNYTLSKDKLRISAVVSAYKSKEFFVDKLKDLKAQTLWDRGDLEIVIVCQDGTFEHEQVRGNDDLTVVVTEDCPSVFEALNRGIKAARGKYVAHAFTDDRLDPIAYEVGADTLDARPDIDLVYHDAFISWVRNQGYEDFKKENDGQRLVRGRQENKPGIFVWPDYSLDKLRQGCFIGPHPIYRANVHQRHGYYHPDYPIAGDYEFWLRIAKEDNFLHIPYALGLYAARPDGLELGNKEQSIKESQKAKALHYGGSISGNGSKPKPDLSVLNKQPIRAWPWPRILVFVPMFPALPHAPEVFYAFIKIAQQGATFMDTGQQRVDWAREKAGQQLLDSSFTHVLMLDADHIHPPDIVQRLARWVIKNPDIKVVGGMNFRRGEPFEPCAFVKGEDGLFYTPVAWDEGLLEVDRIGTGSLLIEREVFETIEEPWFIHDGTGEFKNSWFSEDIIFCEKAQKAGFKIYCDTSTISPHMTSGAVDENVYKEYLQDHPDEQGELIKVGG